MKKNNKPGYSFCAAPWIGGVLYANGELKTCCHSNSVLGYWQRDSLKKAWHSKEFQRFRQIIIAGQFPEGDCRKCFSNRTYTTLRSLGVAFNYHKLEVFSFIGRENTSISLLESLFKEVPGDSNADTSNNTLLEYSNAISEIKSEYPLMPKGVSLSLQKLEAMGKIVDSFLSKNLTPPVIAPYRQVQVISKCNARCIQCPVRHSGIIINGPVLDEKYLPEALSVSEDVFGFFHHGAELLLYKHWKKITDLLVEAGIKVKLFTNTILLTQNTIKYLVDNKLLLELNVSIDGANKETVEAIRVNVNFDSMVKNLSFLFKYAEHAKIFFPISFSFVLMKMNYKELPDFILLIEGIRGESKNMPCSVGIQPLELNGVKSYRDFVSEQHSANINQEELTDIFQKTLTESKRAGIVVSFANRSIEYFINDGCPFPKLLNPHTLLETGQCSTDCFDMKLGEGWYDLEDNSIPTRWIDQGAVFSVNAKKKGKKQLNLSISAFYKSRTCQIFLNNKIVFEERIDLEPKVIDLSLILTKGVNMIRIKSPDMAQSPSEIKGLSSPDNRKLLFNISGIEVT